MAMPPATMTTITMLAAMRRRDENRDDSDCGDESSGNRRQFADDIPSYDRFRRSRMDGDSGIRLMRARGGREHAIAEAEGGGADEDEFPAETFCQRRIAKQIRRADRRDRAWTRAERGRDGTSDRNRCAGDERGGFDGERGQRAIAALFRGGEPPQDAVMIELEVSVRRGDGLRQRRAGQQPAAVLIDDRDREHGQALRSVRKRFVAAARFGEEDVEDHTVCAGIRGAIDDRGELPSIPRPRADLAQRLLIDLDDDRLLRGMLRKATQDQVARWQLKRIDDVEGEQQRHGDACRDRDHRRRARAEHGGYGSAAFERSEYSSQAWPDRSSI